jgi:hypothetical protein
VSDAALFGVSLDSIKELGTGLCAILVLVFSLRWLALKHSATLDARVKLLEKLLAFRKIVDRKRADQLTRYRACMRGGHDRSLHRHTRRRH